MNRDAIASRLTGKFGRILECHAELGSTNDRARELLETLGEKAIGAVVIAARQTEGRGRHGRAWFVESGKSLAMSVALWPRLGTKGASCLPLAGALGVRKALMDEGVECRLKWPNDVLANGRKIAGILVESRFSGDLPQGVVLGAGVNLGQVPEDFPPEIRDTATSVKIESGRFVELEAFAASVINALEPLVTEALLAPGSLVDSAARFWIHEPGSPLRVTTARGVIEGRFNSIGEGGELMMETGGGLEKISAGDVAMLRCPDHVIGTGRHGGQ
jgi:BirA family biotin operon repressor/biotin-[acetyl-CoA-carboxylase] ligase